MRSVRRLLLGGAIVLLALGGFGCKKITTYQYPPTAGGLGASKGTTNDENPLAATPTADAFDEVRRVVENLSHATSFRAHLILPTTNGSATGELEYQKDEGFHGTLQLPGSIMTELYAIGPDLWFRTHDSVWTNLKDTPQGAQTAETFRGAFTFGDVTSTLFLNDMKLVETTTDRDGCERYVFERGAAPNNETMQICVKNNLPVYISSVTSDAKFEIRYRDFGQKISLKAPVIK